MPAFSYYRYSYGADSDGTHSPAGGVAVVPSTPSAADVHQQHRSAPVGMPVNPRHCALMCPTSPPVPSLLADPAGWAAAAAPPMHFVAGEQVGDIELFEPPIQQQQRRHDAVEHDEGDAVAPLAVAGHGVFPNASYPCRRAASFPVTSPRHGGVFARASLLKHRSMSDTNGLSARADAMLTLGDLKRELAHLVETTQRSRSPSPAARGLSPKRMAALAEANRRDSVDHSDAEAAAEAEAAGAKHKLSVPRRARKKISFADDHGLELAEVRVMTEPSECPPRFSKDLMRKLLGELASDDYSRPTGTWVLNFKQPASEYLNFRKTVEKQNVSLENLVLRNDTCRISGTIKVKNVAFDKQVLVRYTTNDWASYFDVPAAYRPSYLSDVFDTFAFELEVPRDDELCQKVQFCVCFRAGPDASDGEFWDSNGGGNYELLGADAKARIDQAELLEANAKAANRPFW